MRDRWFYRCAGVESGPVSFDAITELAHSGRISPQDELRRGDQQFWQPAADIVGLFDHSHSTSDADSMFDDILEVAAVDDGTHQSGQRVGTLLEDQLGYDPHHAAAPNVAEPRFFCRVNGKETGPYTISELQQRANEGMFAQFDRVRQETSKAWIPAQELSEIQFPESASSQKPAVTTKKPTTPRTPARKPSVDDLIDEVLAEPEVSDSAATAAEQPVDQARPVPVPQFATPAPVSSEDQRPILPEPSVPQPPAAGNRFDDIMLPKEKSGPKFQMPSLGMPAIYAGIGLVVIALVYLLVWRTDQPAISGEVTVDSLPIPMGSISFTPNVGVEGRPLSIPILNGKFEAARDDVLGSGPHKVVVVIGNPLGGPPPELTAVPAFADLNGASFETTVDTSSDADDLFVFQLAASDAISNQPSPGSVLNIE